MLLRRVGFLATLATGMLLLGMAFHGMTSVDGELKLAAATSAPASPKESVNDSWSVRDCDRHDGGRHHRGGPEV